jgi:hypothetical protein
MAIEPLMVALPVRPLGPGGGGAGAGAGAGAALAAGAPASGIDGVWFDPLHAVTHSVAVTTAQANRALSLDIDLVHAAV